MYLWAFQTLRERSVQLIAGPLDQVNPRFQVVPRNVELRPVGSITDGWYTGLALDCSYNAEVIHFELYVELSRPVLEVSVPLGNYINGILRPAATAKVDAISNIPPAAVDKKIV